MTKTEAWDRIVTIRTRLHRLDAVVCAGRGTEATCRRFRATLARLNRAFEEWVAIPEA